jgi:hypothetical protein
MKLVAEVLAGLNRSSSAASTAVVGGFWLCARVISSAAQAP